MNFKSITPAEFEDMIAKKEFFLIRAPISSDEAIEGTDLVMDDFDVKKYENELPEDKGAAIVVYCRRGNSSRAVCQKLCDAGYKNVMNLEGGMAGLHAIESR
jgi:rhodanese-related sulfurtransferase